MTKRLYNEIDFNTTKSVRYKKAALLVKVQFAYSGDLNDFYSNGLVSARHADEAFFLLNKGDTE